MKLTIGRHVDRVSLIDTKQGPEWGETRASFFVLDIEIPLDGIDRFAAPSVGRNKAPVNQ